MHFFDFFFLILLEPCLEVEQDKVEEKIKPKISILIISMVFFLITMRFFYHTLQPFQVFLLHTVQPSSYQFLLFVEVVFRF